MTMPTAQEQTLLSIASQAAGRRDFLERFIDHAIQEYDVLGGMIWDCTDASPKPICQHYRGENDMLRLGCSAQQHANFLRQACESVEPLLVSANKESETAPANGDVFPTILLVAVKHGGRTEVVELFFFWRQTSRTDHRKVERTLVLLPRGCNSRNAIAEDCCFAAGRAEITNQHFGHRNFHPFAAPVFGPERQRTDNRQ